MPHSPQVSVILCTYNRPQFLWEAVSSVVGQKFPEWELLVINDGGRCVREVVDGFHDDRIRYFDRPQNRGKAACCNFGIETARGKYIAYIDDDDVWRPNHLAVLHTALESNPSFAAAYSDLYRVGCIRDDTALKRYPFDKKILVSRGFDREFMFYRNNVLHVSLMHTKEAALRVGGYDESVRALIDWNINRKLAYCYDFLHVPMATGEYYVPFNQSDRISLIQKDDRGEYLGNVRKIKADHPPLPWPNVDDLEVVLYVSRWNSSIRDFFTGLYDSIEQPSRFTVIDAGGGGNTEERRLSLGEVGRLKSVSLVVYGEPTPVNKAVRRAMENSSAEYVLWLTESFDFRIFKGRMSDYLGMLRNSPAWALKWEVGAVKPGQGALCKREWFLSYGSSEAGGEITVRKEDLPKFPAQFEIDNAVNRLKEKRGPVEPGELADLIAAIKENQGRGPTIQLVIEHLMDKFLEGKHYAAAARELSSLLERGYLPDNLVRLGRLLLAEKRHSEAAPVFLKAMDCIGLKERDFRQSVFPAAIPDETDCDAYTALIGLGECYAALGRLDRAESMFFRAANLRAQSPRPFVEYGRLLLRAGRIDEACGALEQASIRAKGSDGGVHALRSEILEAKGDLPVSPEADQAALNCGSRTETGREVRSREVGRNAPCPCGSGRKFKKCCLGKDAEGAVEAALSG